MQDEFKDFSKEDLQSYLLTLAEIALSDGLVDKEKDYIELQSVLSGIDPKIIWDNANDVEVNLKNIPHSLKSILIRDAITLAHIDHEYTEDEHDMLIDLSRRMDYPEHKIEEIRKWLMNYWALLEEGATLFSEND